MTLPVTFNPKSDYQYTEYEPYKYSPQVLNKIYHSISRINLIKTACNLEQGSANYLEAIVLSGLLACSPNSLIVSLTPNFLGEALRLTSITATEFVQGILGKELAVGHLSKHFVEHQLLNLYALKNPDFSLVTDLADYNLAVIAEFNLAMLSELQKLINSVGKSSGRADFFLIYDDRSLSFLELEKIFLEQQGRVSVLPVETYNLLESFDRLINSSTEINLVLIPTSYAESNYNPLVVFHEVLEQRKIIITDPAEVLYPLVPDVKSKDSLEIEIRGASEIGLTTQVLRSSLINNEVTKVVINSQKLDAYLLELNQIDFDIKLTLQIASENLTNLSTNLLLQYARSNNCPIIINYLNQPSMPSQSAIIVNYLLTNSLLADFSQQQDHFSCVGDDFTILTWGKASQEVLSFLEASDSLEPEIIILKQIWPLPIEAIVSSVKRTSRLLIVPDSNLSFPLVDVYCNQLSRKLYQYLDAPIKIGSGLQLENLTTDLDQIFYED